MQLTQTQSWQNLNNAQEGESSIKNISSNTGLSIDFSNSLIPQNAWRNLLSLAQEQKIETWRDDMFAGKTINTTENRAVLHTALRNGKNADVQHVLDQIKTLCERIHRENRFTDIVHIGIGGSYLGPKLVCEALRHLPQKMRFHFVGNVDAADIGHTLQHLTPETTLFLVASKTFTTQETMMNAAYAKNWLGDLPVSDHMVALSTNITACRDFGIVDDRIFGFWDWVGGRFSLWSSIGLPIALTYGFDIFQDLLNGAKAMDDHFCEAPLQENLPVMLALYGIWQRNVMNRNAMATLPYAQNLENLPSFLQQLDMESNGKSVDRDGQPITDYATGPIIFGQIGTNGQHAFHQWLHQGTDIIPSEFMTVQNSFYDQNHQRVLNAHATAQAQALLHGKTNKSEPHRHYAGGRPSVSICLPDLSPHHLGALLTLYEHKTFIQGIIWNINSFDQWGVELGKQMAQSLLAS